MARIKGVVLAGTENADMDQGAKVVGGVAAIMMQRPEMAKRLGALTEAVKTTGTLPPRLLELLRLRVAFHNQCRSCMAIRYQDAVDDGLTEDLVCSLEKPYEAPDLTPADQAALRFADLFATNHLAIGDAVYDDLRQYYTEAELVEIGFNCAINVGFGRLAATWAVTEDLSEDYRNGDGKVLAPWDQAGIVVHNT